MPGQTAGWDRLRLRLRSAAPPLYLPAPRPAGSPAADCEVCRGPVRPGFARCYQCDRHALLGPALLADAVVPISYAIKGTPFADRPVALQVGPGALFIGPDARLTPPSAPPPPPARSASAARPRRLAPAVRPGPAACPGPDAASARASVLALLLAFLTDHGPCVWQRAGMPPPDRLAVVPTGAGRPGPHPLLRLVSPYLRLPGCSLALRPGRQGRDLDLDRFQVLARPAGASVLLLDDTWVSGASAQSAAAALKLAGARHVAVVVLGRHVNPDDAASAPLLAGLAAARYDPSACAVHPPPNGTNRR